MSLSKSVLDRVVVVDYFLWIGSDWMLQWVGYRVIQYGSSNLAGCNQSKRNKFDRRQPFPQMSRFISLIHSHGCFNYFPIDRPSGRSTTSTGSRLTPTKMTRLKPSSFVLLLARTCVPSTCRGGVSSLLSSFGSPLPLS